MQKQKFNFKATEVAKMAEAIRDGELVVKAQEENPVVKAQEENPVVKAQEENPVAKVQEENQVEENVLTEDVKNDNIPAVVEEMQFASALSFQAVKAKKSKNGIVIDVPIEDYLALVGIKMTTGKTLKELALQAVHEFVERNK